MSMAAGTITASWRRPITGWWDLAPFVIVLTVIVVTFAIEVRRQRAGGQESWRHAFAKANERVVRHPSTSPVLGVLMAIVGYLFLVAFVARRSPVASVALVLIPLGITAVVGHRRIGRHLTVRRGNDEKPP